MQEGGLRSEPPGREMIEDKVELTGIKKGAEVTSTNKILREVGEYFEKTWRKTGDQ